MPQDFKAGFLKTLWILRDYLPVIVIGGGWVPLLYYHYLLADKSREPIRTRDIDLLKDLYYIFDILVNCPELMERIIQGLIGFRKEHPSWFSRFIKNLRKNFSDMTADGVLMISSQRPVGAFSRLVDEQFRQYVLVTFQGFIEEIAAATH